jgi:hypothetical protein
MTALVALVYPLVLQPGTANSRGHGCRHGGTSAVHRWVPWGDRTGCDATLLLRAAKGWL